METTLRCGNTFGNNSTRRAPGAHYRSSCGQAGSGRPIYYEALATELGMPTPRNLNYVFGSTGTLNELSSKPGWGEILCMQSLWR